VLLARATPEERAEIASVLFSEVRVKDSAIVGARLATDVCLPLIASATARSVVALARPEGSGRALATYRVPIEGRDEWIAAAERWA